MKLVKLSIIILLIIISSAILYGLLFSSFSEGGKELLEITWGVITLIDIYIMFTLFSLWVVYREGLNIFSIIIIVAIMLLGSFAATFYTLYALVKSKGDWRIFWMGSSKHQI